MGVSGPDANTTKALKLPKDHKKQLGDIISVGASGSDLVGLSGETFTSKVFYITKSISWVFITIIHGR